MDIILPLALYRDSAEGLCLVMESRWAQTIALKISPNSMPCFEVRKPVSRGRWSMARQNRRRPVLVHNFHTTRLPANAKGIRPEGEFPSEKRPRTVFINSIKFFLVFDRRVIRNANAGRKRQWAGARG